MRTPLGTKKFRRWWAGINSHESQKRKEILRLWLRYACKTVSIKGDQDQQKIVYTTNNRFLNSKYRTLRKWQALTVWRIVNQHQENHRRIKRPQQTQHKKPVVIVKKRTIVSRGKVSGRVRIG